MAKIEFEGLGVYVYRSAVDQRLVVDIDTSALTGRDVHPQHDVPNIAITVNEYEQRIAADGSYEPRWPDEITGTAVRLVRMPYGGPPVVSVQWDEGTPTGTPARWDYVGKHNVRDDVFPFRVRTGLDDQVVYDLEPDEAEAVGSGGRSTIAELRARVRKRSW